ncbi:RIM-Hypothetical protein protein of the cytomatrix active zone [Nesidiocoris tenuis]|uniref:ERC protein 2 n=1 Tax=Nesidiocoris tenuis TaxID=355587 RepID=A0ABN7ADT6_9HEMI|nr:RIM-Hypothetical protein protein of the cytomatrix active zone [Nesidiocoris tenuis]
MSRGDPYGGGANLGGASTGGNRSPRSARRLGELPTVDRSPSRNYPSSGGGGGGPTSRGSPVGRKGGRGLNTSPDHHGGGLGGVGGNYGTTMSGGGGGGAYYGGGSGGFRCEDDLGSPTTLMEERGRSMAASGSHHRSRSASRPMGGGGNAMSVRYQSLDRAGGGGGGVVDDREFMPIREPRDRSLDRLGGGMRDHRSMMDRGGGGGGGLYLEDDLYGGGGGGGGLRGDLVSSRSARGSPNTHVLSSGARDGGAYLGELQNQNTDLQRELSNLKKELELTNQKLGSSMHSIKTFWSPELKKERALRKEESAKYSLINDQLKLLNSENQKQAMLVRQLEEELRLRMRGPSLEMQQQMEVLYAENEHLTREVAILRETIKDLELRIDSQKQTLAARDESIKKLLEMLQNKGVGKEEERQMLHQMQAMAQKQVVIK